MAKKQTRSPILVPEPRSLELVGGTYDIEPDKLIVIDAPAPAVFFHVAQAAQRALSEFAGVTWHIHAGPAPSSRVGLTIEFDSCAPESELERQGYWLDVKDEGIRIIALDAQGAFYAAMTLQQLLRQYGTSLPQLHIEDQPDFARRGVMLDISRDKVPTMETLFDLVDMMAELKINEVQLYTEHTFAYPAPPVVWADASPLTGDEILALDAYCRERYIDLVPNQNSFGHMTRWLIHDAYRPLAEVPNGCNTPGVALKIHSRSTPATPAASSWWTKSVDELLPHFTSPHFNVGCDETCRPGRRGAARPLSRRAAWAASISTSC